ncbi:hypothetical protein OH77DRAFT_76936 [Trametes cingulata]|nr:hypothetical protein OH77DRAFT_76936 [Trametes cingulata]
MTSVMNGLSVHIGFSAWHSVRTHPESVSLSIYPYPGPPVARDCGLPVANWASLRMSRSQRMGTALSKRKWTKLSAPGQGWFWCTKWPPNLFQTVCRYEDFELSSSIRRSDPPSPCDVLHVWVHLNRKYQLETSGISMLRATLWYLRALACMDVVTASMLVVPGSFFRPFAERAALLRSRVDATSPAPGKRMPEQVFPALEAGHDGWRCHSALRCRLGRGPSRC